VDDLERSGICVGENNFFTKFYNSSPVGITVEGSNTLTRGLIIFGQGLNKSHPHIYNIFDNIQNNDLDAFTINFNKMLKDFVVNYCKSVTVFPTNCLDKRIENVVVKFSNLTNFVSLLGGKIKSSQMLSGDIADVLSNLYLIHSVIWYHKHYTGKNLSVIETFCIEKLLSEAEYKMNKVIDNYPNVALKYILLPTKNKLRSNQYADVNKIYTFIKDNHDVNKIIKEGLYLNNTVLEKMDKLNILSPGTNEYTELYDKVIQVGEYKIQHEINGK
jgi:hypothetical protein